MTLSGPLSSWCGMTFWKCWSKVRKQRKISATGPETSCFPTTMHPGCLSQLFPWPQKHYIKRQHVHWYKTGGHMYQLSGSGGGSSLGGSAYFAPELLLLKWQVTCRLWWYTCNIPSMSSWMSSVWFIWRMARPTRKTISRPWRKRSTVITEKLVCW